MFGLLPVLTLSCSGSKSNADVVKEEDSAPSVSVVFDADSAYSYVERQVAFGPRVNNTGSHLKAGEWLESELRRHGADVRLQETTLKAADGENIRIKNIFGQFNPESSSRLLLLAHWDSRPWADEDPLEANRKKPVDGANDGASGVGVLLEVARQLGRQNPEYGVDILFVDAEDRGMHDDDESWALGCRYFAQNPIIKGYSPKEAILLDMVGAANACFAREQISMVNAPGLLDRVWKAARDAGFSSYFRDIPGGGVTDDHVELLKVGIPAIDIIDFRPDSDTGFPAGWHTVNDNMGAIDKESLRAVGQTVLQFIYGKY